MDGKQRRAHGCAFLRAEDCWLFKPMKEQIFSEKTAYTCSPKNGILSLFMCRNIDRKNMRKIITWLIVITLSFAGTYSAAAPEDNIKQQEEPAAPVARLWNLQDADIISIINEVSLETGKNFVVDPRVTGKISLVSSKPIKPDEVYEVFLSIIGLLGYSAIPSGDVIKIVPNMESGEFATAIANSSSPGKGDEVVVRVIPLENVSANQVIPIIRPMLPQWSNVTAYTPGNVLILLGNAANLQRIMKVIANLDQASDSHVELVPLHQASASQMVSVLNNLQNAGRATGESPQVTIAADERSNSILLGGNRAARLRTRTLIAQLDTPTTGSLGNTQVVYLRYLQAKTFAPILGKVAQNMLGKDSKGGAVDTTQVAAAQTNTASSGADKSSTSSTPENTTNIQAEPSTNALIITAPPSLMRALVGIVAKLDIRPAQVLVEAIIVEIDQDDLLSLGIQWGGVPGADNPIAPRFPTIGAGVIGIIPGQEIHAVLSMLQTKTGVNILSTPSVVVLDNQKATLEIGQNVPMQSGSYSTPNQAGSPAPFNTIDRKPITLRLDVTPQINLGQSVKLKIDLKDDTLKNPDDTTLNPVYNTSKISNSVLVNSCDILVIGGLIRNNLLESVTKVPILGDIPGIGTFFTKKDHRIEKKNLMVFLKPVIVNTPEDSYAITNTKYDLIRKKQINWPEQLSEGQHKLENILPPLNDNTKLPQPFENS
jgi:general secretion pathway protein D